MSTKTVGQYYVQLAAVESARLVYEEQLKVLKGMRAHFGHQLSRVSLESVLVRLYIKFA